jgi:phage terminase large subunit-like protein
LRGPQHDCLWFDELAAFKNTMEVWTTAMLGLRLGKRPRAIVTTTPKPVPLIRDLLKRSGKDVSLTTARTVDNAANLAASFLSEIAGRYSGTRLGRQELDGELLDDVENALWSRDLIEQCRVEKAPVLKRIIVAIDPAVSAGADSDETGVIVAGLGVDDHGYVLEDASGKYQPIDWARKAISLYRVHGADRIIAESNNGGELVRLTLATVDSNAPVKLVTASRGKITRAEPISSLFEQRRAHLVGSFPELEDQMCTFTPGSSGSPDRLDALVWAMSELMLSSNGADGWIEWAKQLAIGPPAPVFDDPLPWRGGGFQPHAAGNELTRKFLDARLETMRLARSEDGSRSQCSRCGGALRGFTVTSDGFTATHFPACPSAAVEEAN